MIERKFLGESIASVKTEALSFVERMIEQGFDLAKIKTRKVNERVEITVFLTDCAT